MMEESPAKRIPVWASGTNQQALEAVWSSETGAERAPKLSEARADYPEDPCQRLACPVAFCSSSC
jgi:hypothetical protein